MAPPLDVFRTVQQDVVKELFALVFITSRLHTSCASATSSTTEVATWKLVLRTRLSMLISPACSGFQTHIRMLRNTSGGTMTCCALDASVPTSSLMMMTLIIAFAVSCQLKTRCPSCLSLETPVVTAVSIRRGTFGIGLSAMVWLIGVNPTCRSRLC